MRRQLVQVRNAEPKPTNSLLSDHLKPGCSEDLRAAPMQFWPPPHPTLLKARYTTVRQTATERLVPRYAAQISE